MNDDIRLNLIYTKIRNIYGHHFKCKRISNIDDINALDEPSPQYVSRTFCYVYDTNNYALIKEHVFKILLKAVNINRLGHEFKYIFVIDVNDPKNIPNECKAFMNDLMNYIINIKSINQCRRLKHLGKLCELMDIDSNIPKVFKCKLLFLLEMSV